MVKITTFQDGETREKSFTEQSLPIPIKTRIGIYRGSSGAYEAEEKDILYLLPSEEKGIEINKITSEYGYSSDSATRASLTDMGTPEDILIYFRGQWPSGLSRSSKNNILQEWRSFWTPKFSNYTNDMMGVLDNLLPSTDYTLILRNPEFETPPLEYPKEIGRGAHIFTANNIAEEDALEDLLGIDPAGVDIDTYLAARTPSELNSWRDYWLRIWNTFNRSDMITFTNTMYNKYYSEPEPKTWWEKLRDLVTLPDALKLLVTRELFQATYKLIMGKDMSDAEFETHRLELAEWILPFNAINKLLTGKNMRGEPEEFGTDQDYLDLAVGAMIFLPVGKLGAIGTKLFSKLGIKGLFRGAETLALKKASPEVIEGLLKGSNFGHVLEAIRIDPHAWAKLAPKFSKEAQALISKSLEKQHPKVAFSLFEKALKDDAGKIALGLGLKIPIVSPKTVLWGITGMAGLLGMAYGIPFGTSWFAKEGLKEQYEIPLSDRMREYRKNPSPELLEIIKRDMINLNRALPIAKELIESVAWLWPLTKEGWQDFADAIEFNKTQYKAELDIMPLPPGKGKLILTPIPSDAKVSVSGQIPTTGIFSQELSIGMYSVTVSKFGYESKTIDVEIVSDETTEKTVEIFETEVEPVPEKGTLNVSSNVLASEVRIDGIQKGITPFSKELEIGSYNIIVTKFKHTLDEKTITIEADKTVTFSAVIEPLPPTPPEPKGILNVGCNIPDSDVRVEGVYRGKTPFSMVLEIGSYSIQVTKFKHTSDSKVVDIRENESATFVANIQPEEEPAPTPPDNGDEFPPLPTPDPYDPTPFTPLTTFQAIDPKLLPEERTMIVNIETTGIKPFASKIIAIGFLDLSLPDIKPFVLIDPDEKKILKAFLDIFKAGNYKKIIGYNVNFDYRYLITKAMAFQLGSKEFSITDSLDLMEAMTKGKVGYVFSKNKSYKLTEWAEYYFNFPKEITDAQMLKEYQKGNLDVVVKFASDQVIRTYELWKLWSLTTNKDIGVGNPEVLGSPLFPQENPTPDNTFVNQEEIIKCKNCLAESKKSELIGGKLCPICKELI
ncbi:MAG: PEGA domain-containing protein [Candidatus Odinarchaeia archaeon]